jgi:hypothetical protein
MEANNLSIVLKRHGIVRCEFQPKTESSNISAAMHSSEFS